MLVFVPIRMHRFRQLTFYVLLATRTQATISNMCSRSKRTRRMKMTLRFIQPGIHGTVGFEVFDNPEPGLHRHMGFSGEEVCAARILLPSVLGRKDPVRMVMVDFTVRLNFVSCDITIAESHVFAFHHVYLVVWMQRTELRYENNVVAFVIEESCSACP